eukprot:11023376-Lingulodinium_polyedra.AAC.1
MQVPPGLRPRPGRVAAAATAGTAVVPGEHEGRSTAARVTAAHHWCRGGAVHYGHESCRGCHAGMVRH